jgi:hypothetical protein
MSFSKGILEVNNFTVKLKNMNNNSLSNLEEENINLISPIIDPMMDELET